MKRLAFVPPFAVGWTCGPAAPVPAEGSEAVPVGWPLPVKSKPDATTGSRAEILR
jgi:hypothetical protein